MASTSSGSASMSAAGSRSSNDSSAGSVGSSSSVEEFVRDLIASVLKDRTAEGGAVSKTQSPNAGDSCTFYAGANCVQARSCYDCLNTLIASDSCMINNNGACVSMAYYNTSKDFRRAAPAGQTQNKVNNYPSSNATYCAKDDKYCSICKDNWNDPFDNSQLSYLRYCRGVGGCVCVQNCESLYYNDNILAQKCSNYGTYGQSSSNTMYASIGIMVGLCVIFAIIALMVRRWARQSDFYARRPQFRHDQPLPQREPTGPQLGLSGWWSMREKLIQTEREQLQRLDTQTLTAPVTDNTVGTIVILETEEGYLPASPSDVPQRRHTDELRPRSASEPIVSSTDPVLRTTEPGAAPTSTVNEL